MRDLPWCSPRPRFMGGQWRLGCDVCAWMAANRRKERHEERRGSDLRACHFARYAVLFHGEWGQMHWILHQHAAQPGHRAATLASGRLLQRLPQRLLNECAADAAGDIRQLANAGVSKGSDEAVAELAASVGDEASRWRPCGRSSSDQRCTEDASRKEKNKTEGRGGVREEWQ